MIKFELEEDVLDVFPISGQHYSHICTTLKPVSLNSILLRIEMNLTRVVVFIKRWYIIYGVV